MNCKSSHFLIGKKFVNRYKFHGFTNKNLNFKMNENKFFHVQEKNKNMINDVLGVSCIYI